MFVEIVSGKNSSGGKIKNTKTDPSKCFHICADYTWGLCVYAVLENCYEVQTFQCATKSHMLMIVLMYTVVQLIVDGYVTLCVMTLARMNSFITSSFLYVCD